MSAVCARKPCCTVRRVLIWICIVFSTFCFLEYLLSVLTYAGGFFSYALPIAAVSVVLLPPLTRSFWKKHLPGWLFSLAQAVYCGSVVLFTVTFLAFVGFLFAFDRGDVQNTGPTAVLVYGCRVDGTQPKEMLAERLDAALALLWENEEAVALVSGGLDEGEQYTEGQVMAWYLEANGIPSARIFIDETAESTKGNIRAFRSMLASMQMEDVPCISVSSSFHIPRIAFLCGKYGLDSTFFGAKTVQVRTWFPSVVREYLAYVKMLVLNSYE
ncbi:MAG: YdcF family protein [Clostridia bacterium]|nr:YdcF family protein [Clostridia bacterium]